MFNTPSLFSNGTVSVSFKDGYDSYLHDKWRKATEAIKSGLLIFPSVGIMPISKKKKRNIDGGINTKLFIDRNTIGESIICPAMEKKSVR